MSYHPAVAQHLPALPEQMPHGHEVENTAATHHVSLRPHNPNHRPRPVSMPPQAYNIVSQPTHSPQTTSEDNNNSNPKDASTSNSTQSKRTRDRDGQQSTRSRTNRLLGDYTLSKTLGAGSMGKVKLATHNVTGEKVCLARFLSDSCFSLLTFWSAGGQDSPPCVSTAPTHKWCRFRVGGQAGLERCLEGDSHS